MSIEISAQALDAPERTSTLRMILRNPLSRVGVVLLVLVLCALVAAIAIDWAAPEAAWRADLYRRNEPPGADGHLLGTDSGGRDVLARLVVATKATMFSGVIALTVAILLGVPGGLVAGYYSGRVDLVLDWLASMVMSLPAIVVMLAIVSSLGTSMWISMTALGCMMAPAVFRLLRAQVHAVRNDLYIDAAKVAGLSDARIVARHIFRVVRGPLVLMISVLAGVAITVQTGLDFLGLGDATTITWGGMLGEGFAAMSANDVLFIWPGLAMAITVAAFFLIASGARDALQRADGGGGGGGGAAARATTAHLKSVPASAEAPPIDGEILVVRNLTIGYPTGDGVAEVVRGAGLTLRRGHTLGVVGESGSGKTQTAFALLDLLPRQALLMDGEVWLDGTEMLRLPSRERAKLVRDAIAYIPQEPMSNLDPTFTIGYQLMEPMRVRGVVRSKARRRAVALLARMGIQDPERVMRSYPHQISGGMAQRVLIAGAVSTEPRILVADEPTTALDVTVQSEILDLLRGVQEEFGMSIILVSHDLGVIADLCDDVAVMRSGQVIESASAEDFFARPRHEYSRMLLDAVPDEHHVRPEYVETPSSRDDARTGEMQR
ncbi:dipeptide/oligopeptide/nickel ABC transporter permease/ATP-binding protein [Nocardioides sp. NBC_00850]|uniref:dipeptide/oligopeptide/nickel ABC transporter permease/ATP-binding protein n=1 Tax=Nocardioides sp. NBC_00850 TaxID=2976001 RepID=UPI003869C253|nr:dipeptide/oligopeptide/nickel ABC transporter permease/ATP-binding protein [Nocardioides sp. NBC_00850]